MVPERMTVARHVTCALGEIAIFIQILACINNYDCSYGKFLNILFICNTIFSLCDQVLRKGFRPLKEGLVFNAVEDVVDGHVQVCILP